MEWRSSAYLLEANIVSILTEATTADVHLVLADETLASATDTALPGALAKLAGMGEPGGRHLHTSQSRGLRWKGMGT